MDKSRVWLATEVFGIFILLIVQIWLGHQIEVLAIILALLFLIGWCSRKELIGNLKIFYKKFLKKHGELLIFASCSLILIFSIAYIANPKFTDYCYRYWEKMGEHLVYYFTWALMQQTLYQVYFINRLDRLFNPDPWSLKNYWKPSLVGGLMFAIVHLPNPVLVPTTLLWGVISAKSYLKNRNIWIIALVHALLATSIEWSWPYEWHQNLAIGLGFEFK